MGTRQKPFSKLFSSSILQLLFECPEMLYSSLSPIFLDFLLVIFYEKWKFNDDDDMRVEESKDEIVGMANGIRLFEKYVANSLSRDGGANLEWWWTHNTLSSLLENMKFLLNRIGNSLSASIIESPLEGDGADGKRAL